jgi:hypothetical protein
MSQSLELDLKTNSDVPQAMEKAKQATESFNKQVENISKNTKKATQGTKETVSGFKKQVEDIGAKFSTSFKDIFLSFLGPMALVTGALAIIAKIIADNQKKQDEANQAAIDGTNELMSAEDRYWAKKQDREKKTKESVEEAETARITVTRQFLDKDPRGRQMLFDFADQQRKTGGEYGPDAASRDKGMQDKIQALIAEEAKKNPTIAVQMDRKSDSFKGPEGFSNVVGVGANPVMQAMSLQLEEAQKQTSLLQNLVDRNPFAGADFTKPSSTPSRASLLQ